MGLPKASDRLVGRFATDQDRGGLPASVVAALLSPILDPIWAKLLAPLADEPAREQGEPIPDVAIGRGEESAGTAPAPGR